MCYNQGTKLRQSLFWNTNPEKIDLKKNARAVVERVLDFGTDAEIRWLRELYGLPFIRKVVKESRSLSPKVKNLWMLLTEDCEVLDQVSPRK